MAVPTSDLCVGYVDNRLLDLLDDFGVSFGRSATAFMFSFTCSGRIAAAITELTFGLCTHHASAYEIICDRYEPASTVVTSNRDFAEWPAVFSNPLMGSAAMDRLVHRAVKLVIEGKSYRVDNFVKRGKRAATAPGGDQSESQTLENLFAGGPTIDSSKAGGIPGTPHRKGILIVVSLRMNTHAKRS